MDLKERIINWVSGREIKTVNNETIFGPGNISNGDAEDVLKKVYPVGSVILSLTPRNPTVEIPGTTWLLIDDGFYLCSCNSNGGEVLPEELPNIKGTWGGAAARSLRNIDGAFKGTTSIQHAASWGGSGADDHITMTTFDASNGQVKADGSYISQENSVYKNGGKVQPKSLKVYMYKRIQ